MASQHQSRLHSLNAHPDRPHSVLHDARGGRDFEDGMAASQADIYQNSTDYGSRELSRRMRRRSANWVRLAEYNLDVMYGSNDGIREELF